MKINPNPLFPALKFSPQPLFFAPLGLTGHFSLVVPITHVSTEHFPLTAIPAS